ncbi:MAG: hypothetical protein OEZ55_00345 [Nitrospinota bacterium]|nr:hypothetical protein [Nitrospinota bacterium]
MANISLSHEVRRGALRFYIWPGMNIYLRLVIFILLVTGGASLMFRYHWAVGAGVFVLGLVFITAHGVSNSRKTPDTSNDRWVVGTAKDLRKIERKVQQGQLAPGSFMDGMTGGGLLTMLAFGLFCAVLDLAIIPEYLFTENMFTIIFLQGSLLITVFWTTNAMTWEPAVIMSKKDMFIRQRDRVVEKWSALGPVARPMLLLDEGDKDLVTPEDIKLFITFEGAPEDFIGVQAQITFNMNQPYLYCVVLAKDTFRPMKDYNPGSVSKIVFQKGADGAIRYLVVRQYTTRDSGYSTNEKQADHVVDTAMGVVAELLGKGRGR